MIYTMMNVCRELNISYQTLKFYCNQGLVPNVKRDKNNRRIFDEKDVKWIKDLTCLKKCGMSIQEMKEYLDLCLEREATILQRKEMLARKQSELFASLNELKDSIEYIDWKPELYRLGSRLNGTLLQSFRFWLLSLFLFDPKFSRLLLTSRNLLFGII